MYHGSTAYLERMGIYTTCTESLVLSWSRDLMVSLPAMDEDSIDAFV